MNGTGSIARPVWRRLLLVLLNLLPPGIGLIWLGVYRIGLALLLGAFLLSYSVWAFPASRGNEKLLAAMLVALIIGAIIILYLWSSHRLWRESRAVVLPFPQRWHWPFWLALLGFIIATVATPERRFRSVRAFYFPSESMSPLLGRSERAWADMRRPDDIRRGDVIVYRQGATEWVTRVMAIGGDRIALQAGVVILNGRAVPQVRAGTGAGAVRLRETLSGGVSYLIEDHGPTPQDWMAERRVPAGTIFVLGDNRDNAFDSRFGSEMDGPGFVPTQNVIGRVFLIFWSKDRDRIGTVVR